MQKSEDQMAMEEAELRSAARAYLIACGLTPTQDAVDQLYLVFMPCLAIMCGRGYDPNGATWRTSGPMGVLTDAKKKFDRLWDRAWKNGKRHDDSAIDAINFLGFYLRSSYDKGLWGEWGEPHVGDS